MNHKSDVLIIGAGITGCAVAQKLSRFQASVTVLEGAGDVAEGATKANSGIIHAGYDAVPGTLKAKYNVRGAALYPSLCKSLGIPFKRCGALVIGLDEADRNTVAALMQRGERNGVSGLEILDRKSALSLEPNLNPQVVCALNVPSSGIVSPYEAAFALADDAAINGTEFVFDTPVLSVSKQKDHFEVITPAGKYECSVLVNCAGASGADIHNMLSNEKIEMVHRRGQYYLLDRSSDQPFSRTIFQCPSVMGKGVLVSPTVHGNLIIGPTAEDISDPLDTATTSEGLSDVIRKAVYIWPDLSIRTNITNFSGVRAHLTMHDFVVGPVAGCPGGFEAVGIESPGLSAAPAVAEDLCIMISDYLSLKRKSLTIPFPVPPRAFHDMSEDQRAAAVQSDPAYGNIICRCEVVTEAEIRHAIRRPVGARSVDGVKRRTRAGMGRCQGGFCMPRVADIIAEETGIPLDKITKNGGNSFLLSGTVDSFLKEGMDHD